MSDDFGAGYSSRPKTIAVTRYDVENAIRECVIELGVKRGYVWHTVAGVSEALPEDFMLQIVQPLLEKLFK